MPPRRRLLWPWFAAILLTVAAVTGFFVWRSAAPPPPRVNTEGFDPAIAEAINQAHAAAARSPRSAEARGRVGMVLLAHQLPAEASDFFIQASVLAPREPRWPYFLGLAQLVDNPLAAATNFDHAVRLAPENQIAVRLKLAETLLSLGRVDEAETHYRTVQQRHPGAAVALLGLAKVANARDQQTEAVPWLEASLQDPTTRRAAHRLLINVYQRLGRANDAARLTDALAVLPPDEAFPDPWFAQVEQLKTGELVWIDRADGWINSGRAADAAQLLEKTIQNYPKSDRAMFHLGRARLRLGNVAGAESILTRAVALAPDSVEAQIQLGIVRLRQGRAQDAQPCFRAAIQAKPNLGEAWFNLGLSLGTEFNRAESIAAFREAIRLKPNLLEAYLGLAVALRADGQYPAAAEVLERALALQPEEPLRRKMLEQLKLVR